MAKNRLKPKPIIMKQIDTLSLPLEIPTPTDFNRIAPKIKLSKFFPVSY